MAFILLRYLTEEGLAEFKGVVTTLAPAFDRARLCRGTLDKLGFYSVPVGVGTDGGSKIHKSTTFEELAHSYMPPRHSERIDVLEMGRELLHRLYMKAKPKSLTLVIIASLKDPAIFLRDNEALFVTGTREVVIMGGVEPWEGTAPFVLRPDTAHNNMFDVEAAQFFIQRCQELGVRMVIVSRWTAYAAKVPRTCYDGLASLGSSVGCRLRNAQRKSIEALWTRACAPVGANARQGLPERCDRAWFCNAFCGGHDDPKRGPNDTIWDLVLGFMQYDAIALLASLPDLREKFFSPVRVSGLHGTTHLVIGKSQEVHGVADSAGLLDLFANGFRQGLKLNHHRRIFFILVTQPQWYNHADELLACVMLRTLYELGILNCAGIVMSPGPGTTPASGPMPPSEAHWSEADVRRDFVEDEAKEIAATLEALGLDHVPVLVSRTYAERGAGPEDRPTAVDHLRQLYEQAPPSGVSLLVAGCMGDVNLFAERNPRLFHDLTQNVILSGGAHIQPEVDENGEPTGHAVLTPDPAAQNNRLDMDSAKRFYALAQTLLVPIIVFSRHVCRACSVPRLLFDVLGSHGGSLGAKMLEMQRASVKRLWRAVRNDVSDRMGLPARCDQTWFFENFVVSEPPADHDREDIWPFIGCFNLFIPLQLIMTLPHVYERCFEGTSLMVRGVRHTVVGLIQESPGVKDSHAIRALLLQCLFMGARLNASEFRIAAPPAISYAGCRDAPPGSEWRFDARHEALEWLQPASRF